MFEIKMNLVYLVKSINHHMSIMFLSYIQLAFISMDEKFLYIIGKMFILKISNDVYKNSRPKPRIDRT